MCTFDFSLCLESNFHHGFPELLEPKGPTYPSLQGPVSLIKLPVKSFNALIILCSLASRLSDVPDANPRQRWRYIRRHRLVQCHLIGKNGQNDAHIFIVWPLATALLLEL